MKLDVYEELRGIWDNIPKINKREDFEFDIHAHKKMLDIFHIGDYFYFILNVRKSFFELVSPEIEKVLGYPASNFDVAFFVNLLHPDDLPVFLNFEAAVERFFQSVDYDKMFKYKVQYDLRFRKSDGNYVRLLHQMLILQHQPTDIRTLVIYTDISHLKTETKPIMSFVGLEGEPSYYNVDVQNIFRPFKPVFTKREREVLIAIANGMSSAKISDTLHISYYTVNSHRKNMLRKTGAKTTSELIKRAFDNGWV